jgi:3-hydroxyisobutyrate dehydrogenase-like beta-hydroxyacid dehydrogenase
VIAPAFSGKFSKIKSNDYSPEFPLHLMSKDLNLVQSVADQSGAVLPAGSATRRIFEEALTDRGELDISAVAPYVRTLANRSNPVT